MRREEKEIVNTSIFHFLSFVNFFEEEVFEFDVSIFDGGKFCNVKKRTFIDEIVNTSIFLSFVNFFEEEVFEFDVSIFDGGKFCNAKKRTFIDNVDEIVNTSIFHFLSFVNFFEKEVYSNSMCPFLMEENFATRRKNREYVNFPLFR